MRGGSGAEASQRVADGCLDGVLATVACWSDHQYVCPVTTFDDLVDEVALHQVADDFAADLFLGETVVLQYYDVGQDGGLGISGHINSLCFHSGIATWDESNLKYIISSIY